MFETAAHAGDLRMPEAAKVFARAGVSMGPRPEASAHQRGFYDATTDQTQVEAWWYENLLVGRVGLEPTTQGL